MDLGFMISDLTLGGADGRGGEGTVSSPSRMGRSPASSAKTALRDNAAKRLIPGN